MLKTPHKTLPNATHQRPRLPLWLALAFLLACLLFITSLLIILPKWWSPSTWQGLTAIVTPLPTDPQPYSLDGTELYLGWIDTTPIALSTETPRLREWSGCRLTWNTNEQLMAEPDVR
jgi:hypothetical protein